MNQEWSSPWGILGRAPILAPSPGRAAERPGRSRSSPRLPAPGAKRPTPRQSTERAPGRGHRLIDHLPLGVGHPVDHEGPPHGAAVGHRGDDPAAWSGVAVTKPWPMQKFKLSPSNQPSRITRFFQARPGMRPEDSVGMSMPDFSPRPRPGHGFQRVRAELQAQVVEIKIAGPGHRAEEVLGACAPTNRRIPAGRGGRRRCRRRRSSCPSEAGSGPPPR